MKINNQQQYRYKKAMLYVLSISILFSCQHSEIEEQVRILTQKKVTLNIDSLIYVGDKQECFKMNSIDFKLVIFFDSTNCSKCALSNLYLWSDLLDSLSKASKTNVPFFIFSPSRKDLKSTIYFARHSQLNHYIYIDTCSIFIRKNPHIPNNNLMHTFLLNDRDSVVLVGNPIQNKKSSNITI